MGRDRQHRNQRPKKSSESTKPQKPVERAKQQDQASKTTADHLKRAVYLDLLPQDPQTCEDFGFNRAVTAEEKCYLLGLYIGLIKYQNISPETIYNWRIRGVLVDEIKAVYYKIPEGSRGAYFPWFLQNQRMVALAGQPLSAKELQDQHNAILLRTWWLTGGSKADSPGKIRAAIELKPAEAQKCYALYKLILSGKIPPPSQDLWIDFGFAACAPGGDEDMFGVHYRGLINTCTFREFCDAYRHRRLLDLFNSKGQQLWINVVPLRDLLSGNLPLGRRKSVWDLKRHVLQETSASIIPSVATDYGFINCSDAPERQQLKTVYRDFFITHRGDPLALHDAAIQGNLYGYLSNIMHVLQTPKYQRLLTNPYPLPVDAPQADVANEPGHSKSWYDLFLVLGAGVGGVLLVMLWKRM